MIDDRSTPISIPDRLSWIALVAFVTVVVASTLFAASGGVRGSDQYWYLADVETLARDRVIGSTTVFPVGLLGDHGTLPPPFIHNVLSIYLAALPALVVGPLGGWIVLNLVATLATSFLIYRAARVVASVWAAALCAVLYPLLPVTVWQTAQPLAEASTSLFGALAFYLVTGARVSAIRWLGVVLAVGLLYFSRQSYLPLLLAAPLWFGVLRACELGARIRDVLPLTALLAAVALAITSAGQLMFAAANVRVSYTRLWHTAVPGRSDNMWFNFDLSSANLADQLPFDTDILVPKLVGHLAEQLVSFGSLQIAVFYWTFNALALVAVAKLWRERGRLRRRIIIAALAPVAVHLVTIVLFQNQFRYSLPALPGLLVVLAMVLEDTPRLARRLAPRPAVVVLVVTAVALVPSGVLALTIRDEGIRSASVEAATRDLFDEHVGPSENVLIVYSGTPQVFAYAVRPRLILYTSPEYNRAEYARLLDAFPARWIFAPVDSAALTHTTVRPAPAGVVDALGTQWGLFELVSPASP